MLLSFLLVVLPCEDDIFREDDIFHEDALREKVVGIYFTPKIILRRKLPIRSPLGGSVYGLSLPVAYKFYDWAKIMEATAIRELLFQTVTFNIKEQFVTKLGPHRRVVPVPQGSVLQTCTIYRHVNSHLNNYKQN